MHLDLLFIPLAYLAAYFIHRPKSTKQLGPLHGKHITTALLLDKTGKEVSKRTASVAEKFIYKQHGSDLILVYALSDVKDGVATYKET